MPTEIIPLVGGYNQRVRNTSGKDQRFIGVDFNVVENNITRSMDFYLSKRRPFQALAQYAPDIMPSTLVFQSASGDEVIVSTGSANLYNVYAKTTASNLVVVGSTGSYARTISDVLIDGQVYFLITCLDSTGWYLPEDAAQVLVPTFTATTTNTSPTLTVVSSTANLHVGQRVTGTGIPVDTRILSIDTGASTVTMTANATASGGGVTVTFEPLAKIIDADFPGNNGLKTTGGFAELDGYVFIMTTNGRIYNSDLNSVVSWGASNYITANQTTDNGVGVARYKDRIVGFGIKSTQFFYNAGNPSGSPLSSNDELAFNIGCASAVSNNRPYVAFKDTIYWVSGKQGSSFGIYRLTGFSPEVISTANVSEFIDSGFSGNYFLSAYESGGYTHVYIHAGGQSVRMALNVELGIWSEPNFNNSTTESFHIFGAQSALYMAGGPSGIFTIYSLASSGYLEFTSSAVFSRVQTKKINFGTEALKTYNKISLIGSDIETSGSITLEYSDDDYATWVTVGTFDLTKSQPTIYRCSAHRGGRAWRLTHSANAAFRAQALKFDYKVGVH